MPTTTSADGTVIGFDERGAGAPLILVLGAFNTRDAGVPLADSLADQFRVVVYDRRGRGASGDGPGYSPDREVEDIAALIEVLGGHAHLFGYSSGAVLALRAAAAGLPVDRMALYEPPVPMPGRDAEFWGELSDELAMLAATDRGAAVEAFQTRAIGMPPELVVQLRGAPFRPALDAMAHTLAYETSILAVGPALARSVRTPTLVAVGDSGMPTMIAAAEATVADLPHGEIAVLAGQNHDIVPDVLGPVVAEFLTR